MSISGRVPASQAQSFGDVRIEGHGSSLVINQTVVVSAETVLSRPLVDRSPYVGLRRFEEKDQALFFGRDALAAKLILAVRDHRFTLVAGASGSGKSSLIRAGLFCQLHKRLARLRVLTLVPDRDPFARLHAALLQAGFDLDAVSAATAASDQTLVSLCSALRAPDESWLLFIDQFEELFTLCSDVPRRRAFLDGLVRLIESGPAEVKLVAAMRADFFDRLDLYPRLLELAQPPFFVTSPSEAELRQCVEQPAARHGVLFEEGLVAEILHDLRGQPGALPLLQYTLDRLWSEDSPVSERTLIAESYRRLGGISGALKQRADELYGFRAVDRQRTRKEPRPPEQREGMRRLFLRLLDLSDHGENARSVSNRALLSELPVDEQQLVAELADEKLLITNRSSSGLATVEVAHAALLTAWPRLQEWIEQAREVIYLRNRLCVDAAIWHRARATAGSNPDEELWRGSRLTLAAEMEQQGDFLRIVGDLPASAAEFLRASRNEQEQQRERERQRQKELEDALSRAREQQRRAEAAREQAEQHELDMVVEQGRQLLVEREKPLEALLWLHRAAVRGSKSTILPYLMADALRPLEATRSILQGHSAWVCTACYSPDGKRVITASLDRTARVWDTETGKILLRLQGHGADVFSASYSPDGSRIVTSSADQTAKIWDAETGNRLLSIDGHTGEVQGACYSPDGTRIATASRDQTARIWDSKTGALLLTLQGHKGYVYCVAYSPDGRRLATASSDDAARVWDARTGAALLKLKGHTGSIASVGYSPDGRRIITASLDATACVWDAESGQHLLTLCGHIGYVNSAYYSPGGESIVTAGADQTIRLWDPYTAQTVCTLVGHTASVSSARYSPDGQSIITSSFDQTARIWEPAPVRPVTLLGHMGSVSRACFSPDGRRIVTASLDQTVWVWDVESGQPLLSLVGHTADVSRARYSPDGRRIITASDDSTARIWDAESGQLLLALTGHTSFISGFSLSRDGRRIATGSFDKTARIWDTQDGACLLTLQGHTATVVSVRFSPTGKQIVTASADQTARIWDAESGQLLLTLSGHTDTVSSIEYSPDGRHLVTGSGDQSARVWDAESGQLLSTLQGHIGYVSSARYSPNGRRIITSSRDHTARVWDAESGKPLLALLGHTRSVTSARYSPDGRRIVTASEDNTARIWDAETGKLSTLLQGHSGSVFSARFSPDGKRLATASDDQTVRVWMTAPATLGAEPLTRFLRSRLALRLEGGACVSAELESDPKQEARGLSPPRWDLRESLLWPGIYALQAGHKEVARSAFREARTRLQHFQHGPHLLTLDLAEAALDEKEDALVPEPLAKRIRQVIPDASSERWMWLLCLVQDSLYRPRWAIWMTDQIRAHIPQESHHLPLLAAGRLEALLSIGQTAEVLREGEAIWKTQPDPKHKPAVAAFIYLAALQQGARREQQTWAQRVLEGFAALNQGSSRVWTFDGSRHAFSIQPDSKLRTRALDLFTLLEQKRTPEGVENLGKLLGLLVSRQLSADPKSRA